MQSAGTFQHEVRGFGILLFFPSLLDRALPSMLVRLEILFGDVSSITNERGLMPGVRRILKLMKDSI